MPVYIPERTIDSMLAIELTRFDPHSLIWSPQNTTKFAPDHFSLRRHFGVTVFECKSVTSDSPWMSTVDEIQLAHYLSVGLPVQYIFLAEPRCPCRPHIRNCMECGGGECRECPRDARLKSELSPLYRAVGDQLRLQPWFGHWAWVISADDLKVELGALGKRRDRPLPADDAYFSGLKGAERFCHVFSGKAPSTSRAVPPGRKFDEILGQFGVRELGEGSTEPVFWVTPLQ